MIKFFEIRNELPLLLGISHIKKLDKFFCTRIDLNFEDKKRNKKNNHSIKTDVKNLSNKQRFRKKSFC